MLRLFVIRRVVCGLPCSLIGEPPFSDDNISSSGEPDGSDGSNVAKMGRRQLRQRRRRPLRDWARADAIAEVTEEMSKEFGTLVHPRKCRARTWGCASGVQCSCRPLACGEFCGRHQGDKLQPQGRIDDVLSVELYEKLIGCHEKLPQSKPAKRQKHY